jgi:hypothetical protein
LILGQKEHKEQRQSKKIAAIGEVEKARQPGSSVFYKS